MAKKYEADQVANAGPTGQPGSVPASPSSRRTEIGEPQLGGEHALNPYGRFAPDGREFWITNPRPPRPWVNVISNPRMGLAVSQTGSGFTWIDNSQLGVITRWQQDMVRDSSGKFLYARDLDSGECWSLSPAPQWPRYDTYTCRHGLGYTTFVTEYSAIAAEWTLFVHPEDTAELWLVTLRNRSGRPRRLELTPCLEWCCGVAPDPRREFHKLFIETWFDRERSAVFARNHMWEVPSPRYGHWNMDFPFVSALGSTEPVAAAQGDKGAFLGRNGRWEDPQALHDQEWYPRFGRHDDPVAALRVPVQLAPGEKRRAGFVLAVGESTDQSSALLEKYHAVPAIEAGLEAARESWRHLLAPQQVDTPDEALNFLTNDWLRYQAISGRIWGRCGYYQQSGAFGFRDQLQDSQVWLPIDPARCRAQILLHAAHQFADGSVYHWWHPLSEQGHITRMTDDLLWLAFVTTSYLKETGDFAILEERAPYLNDPSGGTLTDHVERAFRRVFGRMSPRGLPYIGAGDWNDGLSACGLQEKGESIWLGQFLVGLLADWAEVYRRTGAADAAADFEQRRAALVTAINTQAWDGAWYIRATLDDGTVLGSAKNSEARIFLNAQTWAILNDVAPPERAAACMAAVEEHLASEVGPLLLTPAFRRPDERIGYITRYAPGLRENGGVYTHAACWAIAAACKSGRAALAARMLGALNPARRDPERYWAEPYVTPGNIDGPESPYYGRGGWTWYTGSAAWLQRVITDWVLGVRCEWKGLRIQPCLPPDWTHASLRRRWRGCEYLIDMERSTGPTGTGRVSIALDGLTLPDNIIPPPQRGGTQHKVVVRC